MTSQTLDPVKAKNEGLQLAIDSILNEESLLEKQREALRKLDTWFVKKKLKNLLR